MDASQGPNDTPENAKNAAAAHGAPGAAGSDAPRIDSPSLVPEQGEAVEAPTAAEAPRIPTTALVLASATTQSDQQDTTAAASKATKQRWRFPALSSLAATIALALGVGAIAGSLSTLGMQQAMFNADGHSEALSLQQAVTRLNNDVASLKASIENSSKAASGLLAKLAERLDRTERAQGEPAAKLAKISEAVDRLEKRTQVALVPPATIPAVPSPVASARPGALADVTGSIAPSAAAKDLSRLPVIPGWVLHSVYGGTALVRTRMGLMEVEVGDPLPGGGRVEAIRRDGGRWVVVTSRGLIVTR
jgi:hypothetical protein